MRCWNEIYMNDCSSRCPHCGYTENWDVELTCQLDKEKNDGNMPKMQLQYRTRAEGEKEESVEKKTEKYRNSEIKSYKKAW